MPELTRVATEKVQDAEKPYWRSACGRYEVWHADCRTVLPLLYGVDHVISDPPYGTDHTHDGHLSSVVLRNGEVAGQPLRFDGISGAECVDLCRTWCGLASRWVVFTCEWKYAHLLDEAGLLVRLGIWRKPDGAPQFTGDRPGTGWEAVCVCHRPGKKRWNGGGKHGFWTYPKGQQYQLNGAGHPCCKPLALFEQLVLDFTDVGDCVLDSYMGSGTTGVACVQTGRRFVGVEVDLDYCRVGVGRIQRAMMDCGQIVRPAVSDDGEVM